MLCWYKLRSTRGTPSLGWPEALPEDTALFDQPPPSELRHVSAGAAGPTVPPHTVGTGPAGEVPVPLLAPGPWPCPLGL